MVGLDDVRAARPLVERVARRTPLELAPVLSAALGERVTMKLETFQPTGSFKVRGAANVILALGPEERRRGVVTASTGNHGRAVAHVAGTLGIPAVVCLSERVEATKRDAVAATGAEVVVAGDSQDQAQASAERLAQGRGLTLVPPFDDERIVAGQGTIGLELLEDEPELGTVLVPLSGGGLIAGIAAAVKGLRPGLRPGVRVVGVSMSAGAAMHASLAARRPIALPEAPTLADSLQGGVGADNRVTFAMVRDLVDEVVLVDEEAIAAAMASALDEHALVLEGAAAVGLAALRSGALTPRGPTACVLSGRNVGARRFLAAVEPHLRRAPAGEAR